MARGRLFRELMPIAIACALACPSVAVAQTVSATTASGDVRIQVGAAASLPGDFPADVWLPDGRVLERVERAGAGSTTLVFDAAGDCAALAEAYDRRMQAAGWTPARVAPAASGQVRAWEKDSRAVVAAFVAGAAGGTRVRLQVLPRR